MTWTVSFHNKAARQFKASAKHVQLIMRLLAEDLKTKGPAPGKQWPNYGKLRGRKNKDMRHCHLIKGNPTYVCCWEVKSKLTKTIEVYYVGTHEKAPY